MVLKWHYIWPMRQNFKASIRVNGCSTQAIIVPEHRKDGMYYEVNIPDVERFYMSWSAMDRYDIVPQEGLSLSDDLVLAVSDAIEEKMH